MKLPDWVARARSCGTFRRENRVAPGVSEWFPNFVGAPSEPREDVQEMIKTTALITIAGAATFAAADVIVSYGYSDLVGAFDGSTFTADASDISNGDVTRLTPNASTAQFDTGFAGVGFADVAITMDISNVTATSAVGVGSVTLTDTDGDTLTAEIAGDWTIINPFGFMFFAGTSANYSFSDNGQEDGLFNGTTSSFALAGLVDQLFDGAISLLLQSPGGFGGEFGGVTTEADGLLIPTPGVLAIAGVGFASMARRRRG
jgi:hypothetical protein